MALILIAHELRELLPDDPAPGYLVEWIAAADPTPEGEYDAIVPLLSRRIGEAELESLPRLRIVANCAVGYDNIDLDAASRREIIVTNTPEVLTESTADLTWALILSVARRLKEAESMVASGAWPGWHPTQLLGLELHGAELGIVGAGRIGQAVGRRAMGFGMRVVYSDRERYPDFEADTGAIPVELDDLLARSDIVTVHVPSTPETRGSFDASFFSRMKLGAFFINTARGDLVDEEALLEALAEGALSGAGLDVFPDEPSVNASLVADPRVVTLPHIGSATTHTRRAMAELAVGNAMAVLRGDPPMTPVTR